MNYLTIYSKRHHCKIVLELNNNYPFKLPKISFYNTSISYSY